MPDIREAMQVIADARRRNYQRKLITTMSLSQSPRDPEESPAQADLPQGNGRDASP